MDLDDFLVVRTVVTEAHLRDVDEGVQVANGFLPVHIDAIELIRLDATEQGRDDTALVLLGVHVLNLYTSVVELALRGRFDVAWHLRRAMFDACSLTYPVAKDSDLANRFLQGDLRAAEAREYTIEDLAATGYSDITDRWNDRWNRNRNALNELTHVNVSHLGMLVSADGGGIVPHYGGHENAKSVRLLLAAAHEDELLFLTFLEHLRRDALPKDWSERCLVAKVRFGAFRERYESEWTGIEPPANPSMEARRA